MRRGGERIRKTGCSHGQSGGPLEVVYVTHSFPCIDSYRASLMGALSLYGGISCLPASWLLSCDSYPLSLQALFSCYEVDSDGVNIPEPPIPPPMWKDAVYQSRTGPHRLH